MRICLVGASGRLGSEVSRAALEKSIDVVVVGRENLRDPVLFGDAFQSPGVILDVSLPEGTDALLEGLSGLGVSERANVRGVVIGTTGHADALLAKIKRASETYAVCVVSNFSRGVFLFEEMLKARTENGQTVADLARSLGFDLTLWESHHIRKLDAPSGTAKTLARAAGIPEERVASTRVGAVVGEHIVFASNDSEELRIQHIAHSRRLFALGALELTKRIYAASPRPGMHEKSIFM